MLLKLQNVMKTGDRRLIRVQERLFTALAWTPKATVQAALGGLALDQARDDTERRLGQELVATAVLCILVTAPPGAFLISSLGPRLLKREALPPEDAVPKETGMPGE